jgi:hypothetical protein
MPAHTSNLNRTNEIPLGERGEAARYPAPKPVTTVLDGLAYSGWLVSNGFELPTAPIANLVQTASPKQAITVPACNAEVLQSLGQENMAEVDGHAWLSVEVAGRVRGRLENVEVGEVTADIRQSNAANQSVRVMGDAPVTVSQTAVQANETDVDGNVGVTLCVLGDYVGRLRNIDVGLVVDGIKQGNHLTQKLNFGGTVPAEFGQDAAQGNLVSACGSLDVTFKVGGRFAGTLRDADLGLLAGPIRSTTRRSRPPAAAAGMACRPAAGERAADHRRRRLQPKIEHDFLNVFQRIDIGLVTGTITQRNQASQTVTLNGKADAPVQAEQSAQQVNLIVAEGTLDARIDICGTSTGRIEDVEIGLITADITQLNFASQSASSSGSRTGTATDQDIIQQNIIEVFADLRVHILVDGDFSGHIRDVEIGLLSGSITQVNEATQLARPAGPAPQTQLAAQENRFRLDLIDDVEISIIVQGGFDGMLDGLTVGLIFAEVEQGNFSFQQTSGPEAAMARARGRRRTVELRHAQPQLGRGWAPRSRHRHHDRCRERGRLLRPLRRDRGGGPAADAEGRALGLAHGATREGASLAAASCATPKRVQPGTCAARFTSSHLAWRGGRRNSSKRLKKASTKRETLRWRSVPATRHRPPSPRRRRSSPPPRPPAGSGSARR